MKLDIMKTVQLYYRSTDKFIFPTVSNVSLLQKIILTRVNHFNPYPANVENMVSS